MKHDINKLLNSVIEFGADNPAKEKFGAAFNAYLEKLLKKDNVIIDDAISYFPFRYEKRMLDELVNLPAEGDFSGCFRIKNAEGRATSRPGLYRFSLWLEDKNKTTINAYWMFYAKGKRADWILDFYKKLLPKNEVVVVHGTVEVNPYNEQTQLKVTVPDDIDTFGYHEFNSFVEKSKEIKRINDSPNFNRWVPVYRLGANVDSKQHREFMFNLVNNLTITRSDDDSKFPEHLRKKFNVLPFSQILKELHFPADSVKQHLLQEFKTEAQRSYIFTEFYELMNKCYDTIKARRTIVKPQKYEFESANYRELTGRLAFELTSAQKRVIGDLATDFKQPFPMNRLVQGDVGCGKTAVFSIAAGMCLKSDNTMQVGVIAPTEIVAVQHFRYLEKLLGSEGKVVLLTGKTKAKEKREIYKGLEDGSIRLCVGTHALFSENVNFKNLVFLVIDEQHRFGVDQRMALSEKVPCVDIVSLSATPIPRSLSLTAYGDLDVSIIDELPPGRTPVKTVLCNEEKRPGVYAGIERELNAGRQVYVVFPLIQESEKSDLKAAEVFYEQLKHDNFRHRRVGLMHGKLKGDEKQAIIEKFIEKDIDILVATTVVEVGVDVPNATLMIIENAERFGLSALHQLRGRVGRGGAVSFCVLMSHEKKSDLAHERLGVLTETNDGFKIAQRDLELRGPGEMLGTKQAGKLAFKIADITRDSEILLKVKEEVFK